MRKCFDSLCHNGKLAEYVSLDSDAVVITDTECPLCDGTGLVEDGCYCYAFEQSECCCGYDWEGEELYNHYIYYNIYDEDE